MSALKLQTEIACMMWTVQSGFEFTAIRNFDVWGLVPILTLLSRGLSLIHQAPAVAEHSADELGSADSNISTDQVSLSRSGGCTSQWRRGTSAASKKSENHPHTAQRSAHKLEGLCYIFRGSASNDMRATQVKMLWLVRARVRACVSCAFAVPRTRAANARQHGCSNLCFVPPCA
eukprot:1724776-Amphidinium_carterae.1